MNDRKAASSTKLSIGKPGKRKKSVIAASTQGAPTLNTELETSFKMVTHSFLVSPKHSLFPG